MSTAAVVTDSKRETNQGRCLQLKLELYSKTIIHASTINLHMWCGALSSAVNIVSFLMFFFAYDLCKFCCCSPHKPALHHFHSISTSSQFVRTDSCLLLQRRQSENIEPAHSTKRQHHQHNSDSSEKVLDEQSLRSAFNFSSNISGARKKKKESNAPT